VGKAMSGAFLAHGYQANRLIALRDPGVMVHAMGKASAARVTLRSVEELEALAASVPPMAYDIDSYASLGLLWETLSVEQIEQPTANDLARVTECLHWRSAMSPARDLSGASVRPIARPPAGSPTAEGAVVNTPLAHDLLWGMTPAQLPADAPRG
jgi:malonate decarboxylase gamma subunit